MRFIVYAALTFLLATYISGCIMHKKMPAIEVVGGEFRTPQGDFDIEVIGDVDESDFNGFFSGRRDNDIERRLFLYSAAGKVMLAVGVLDQYRDAKLIFRLREDSENRVYADRAKYVFKDSEYVIDLKVKFALRTFESNGAKYGQQYIYYDLPEPLDQYNTVIQGGGLRGAQLRRFEEQEDDVHHLILPFKIDGDEYVFDVKFKVGTRSRWAGGVPGM